MQEERLGWWCLGFTKPVKWLFLICAYHFWESVGLSFNFQRPSYYFDIRFSLRVLWIYPVLLIYTIFLLSCYFYFPYYFILLLEMALLLVKLPLVIGKILFDHTNDILWVMQIMVVIILFILKGFFCKLNNGLLISMIYFCCWFRCYNFLLVRFFEFFFAGACFFL